MSMISRINLDFVKIVECYLAYGYITLYQIWGDASSDIQFSQMNERVCQLNESEWNIRKCFNWN